MSAAKAKGTAAETAVVRYLQQRGWRNAERRALAGSADRGDVAGIAGVCIEVKSCAKHDLARWTTEARTEQANTSAAIGAVVAKKRGTTDAGEFYAILPFAQLCDLLDAAGFR